jgi:hypothetical protein
VEMGRGGGLPWHRSGSGVTSNEVASRELRLGYDLVTCWIEGDDETDISAEITSLEILSALAASLVRSPRRVEGDHRLAGIYIWRWSMYPPLSQLSQS